MIEEIAFRKWLTQKKRLTTKSSNDVLSRLRRACKLTNSLLKSDPDRLLLKLDRSSDFQKLGIFVKPQIKRSVRLMSEFNKTK